MGHGVVAREACVAPCVRIERRRGAAAEHARRLLVLEDDHDNVIERGHGRRGGRGFAGEQPADQERSCERLQADSMRRRPTWIPTSKTTTTTAIAAPPY